MKRESARIELEKSHQLTKCVPHQIPIFVEPLAIVEDMASGFDWVKPTRTIKFFSWEKP